MEGTQKPWWIRSVCCCLGFVKPFSYIVPALKILGNCSAGNFIIKLNMSGWQRPSCLLLFFCLTVGSLWFIDRMRGPGSFLITHSLVPARRLLIYELLYMLYRRWTQQHSPASSFSLFLFSSGSMGHLLSTCWQYTFADQQTSSCAHHSLFSFTLFSCLLIYFN